MATTRSRKLIGYWHQSYPNANCAPLPHPHALVDPGWEPERRAQIVEYLKAGLISGWLWCGHSYCRLCCTVALGSDGHYDLVERVPGSRTIGRDRDGNPIWPFDPRCNGNESCCDDRWFWPSGLAHYVERHAIRLPDEFVSHAAARGFRPAPASSPEFKKDWDFWMNWAAEHAPFSPRPDCFACMSTPPRRGRRRRAD